MSRRGWKIHWAYYLYGGLALAAAGLVLAAALLASSASASEHLRFPYKPMSVHVLYPGETAERDPDCHRRQRRN